MDLLPVKAFAVQVKVVLTKALPVVACHDQDRMVEESPGFPSADIKKLSCSSMERMQSS